MHKVSKEGLEFIAEHEGVVLRAYKCPAGVPTIGVGHTNRAGGFQFKMGDTITLDQAYRILNDDIARNFGPRTRKHLSADAPQHAYDGALSFDYNTGRIHNASWVKLYNQGKTADAKASLMQWTKARGKVIGGLVNRRNAEKALIFDGHYSKAKEHRSDLQEYQKKLKQLGFNPGAADGVNGKNTKAAVLAFQKTHPQLNNDGILGRATKAAIDRSLDLGKKSKQGSAGAAAGAAGTVAVLSSDVPDWVFWGCTAILVGIAAWLIYKLWSYRDEISAKLKKGRRHG